MSNIRLFFPESLSVNLRAKLKKSQSHYLTKVMRVKSGEFFSVFNSSGEWKAKVIEVSKGIVEFGVLKKLKEEASKRDIWLAFTPIKSNYFSFMIQKTTELGITKYIPIISDRTIVRKVNLERLEKIVIEASEQSNRLSVPKIEKAISLKEFLKKNQNLDVIFGDVNKNNNNLNLKKIEKKPVCILIGPEGDFSEEEREKILKLKNIIPFKINNNILRSETAAISIISIISFNLLS